MTDDTNIYAILYLCTCSGSQRHWQRQCASARAPCRSWCPLSQGDRGPGGVQPCWDSDPGPPDLRLSSVGGMTRSHLGQVCREGPWACAPCPRRHRDVVRPQSALRGRGRGCRPCRPLPPLMGLRTRLGPPPGQLGLAPPEHRVLSLSGSPHRRRQGGGLGRGHRLPPHPGSSPAPSQPGGAQRVCGSEHFR